jgi:hypothetical protein
MGSARPARLALAEQAVLVKPTHTPAAISGGSPRTRRRGVVVGRAGLAGERPAGDGRVRGAGRMLDRRPQQRGGDERLRRRSA